MPAHQVLQPARASVGESLLYRIYIISLTHHDSLARQSTSMVFTGALKMSDSTWVWRKRRNGTACYWKCSFLEMLHCMSESQSAVLNSTSKDTYST